MIHSDILETIEKYTKEKYICYEIAGDEERVSIADAEMESMIEDLIAEIVKRDQIIRNIKQDMQDNYKQITSGEMYGI